MLKDLIKTIVSKTKKVVTLPTRTSSGDFLLKETDFGHVHVEFSVVQEIAERALSAVKGINESEITIEKSASNVIPMKAYLNLALSEGYSAIRVSEEADKAINDAMKKFMNLEFYLPVEVKVKQITTQAVTKRRRVR